MNAGLLGVKKNNTPYFFDMRSLSGIHTASIDIIPQTSIQSLTFDNEGIAEIDSTVIPSIGETVVVTTNNKKVNATCTFSLMSSMEYINAYPVVLIDDDELDFYIEFRLEETTIHKKDPLDFSTTSVKVESSTIMPSIMDIRASGSDVFPCFRKEVLSASASGSSACSFTFADGIQMIVDLDDHRYVCPLQDLGNGTYKCGAEHTQETIDYEPYPFQITFSNIAEYTEDSGQTSRQYCCLYDYSITLNDSSTHEMVVYAIVSPYDYIINQKVFLSETDDTLTVSEAIATLTTGVVNTMNRYRHFRWFYKHQDPTNT